MSDRPKSILDVMEERERILRDAPRMPHVVVDGDCWFSCPKAVETSWGEEHSACCNEEMVRIGSCTCGADAFNAKLEAVIRGD